MWIFYWRWVMGLIYLALILWSAVRGSLAVRRAQAKVSEMARGPNNKVWVYRGQDVPNEDAGAHTSQIPSRRTTALKEEQHRPTEGDEAILGPMVDHGALLLREDIVLGEEEGRASRTSVGSLGRSSQASDRRSRKSAKLRRTPSKTKSYPASHPDLENLGTGAGWLIRTVILVSDAGFRPVYCICTEPMSQSVE